MEDILYYNNLYDYYQDLLTPKQREYFEGYYFQDLSLSELSEKFGVSRNAIHQKLKIVKEKLDNYEAILKCYDKKIKVLNLLYDENLKEKIDSIL